MKRLLSFLFVCSIVFILGFGTVQANTATALGYCADICYQDPQPPLETPCYCPGITHIVYNCFWYESGYCP